MYVISYDISETKRRNKIFKLLKNYGEHRQYSVFECDLTKKRFQQLYHELFELMQGEEEGNIRIYDLCQNCCDRIKVIGIEKSEQKDGEDDGVIVI